MLTDAMKADLLKNKIEYFSKQMEELTRRFEQIAKLEAVGFDLVKNKYDASSGTFRVKRDQLGPLRKIVGSFSVQYKNVAYDYDDTHMLDVTVKPNSKDFDQLTFTYQSPHRGKRCHVEEVKTSYKTLVCKPT